MLERVLFCLTERRQKEELKKIEGMESLLAELKEKAVFMPEIVSCESTNRQKQSLTESCLLITDQPDILQKAKKQGAVCIAYVPSFVLGSGDFSQADLILEGFDEVDVPFLEQTWCRAKGKPCLIAEGERVLLKELTAEDVPELYRIYHQPEVRAWVSEMAGTLSEEQERMIAYQKYSYSFYGYGIWGIFRKKDKKLLGSCGLEQKEGGVELGYVIDPDFWGQGIAAEAALLAVSVAKKLELEVIYAKIAAGNQRSKAIAEKLGMKRIKEWVEKGKRYERYELSLQGQKQQ